MSGGYVHDAAKTKVTKKVTGIYAKFNNLEPEKRERIINAAIEQFVQSGYDKASTNEIVRKAGISKGSLFKYFNSKKELFLYVFNYVIHMLDVMYDEMDWSERDLFERFRKLGFIKLRIMRKYPQLFDFVKVAAQEEDVEVRSEITNIYKRVLDTGLEKIYDNVDWTKFRDDIDIQKAVQLISWSMWGYAEQQRANLRSFEEVNEDIIHEWESYFGILKRCFYKKED